MALNSYILRSTVVGALGGLLFGFDTVVISGTTQQLSTQFALTPWQLGFTVSSALLGTVAGALLSGIPGERIGSRDTLRIMAALYLISALGCAFAPNWAALILFRFIGGIGIGGSSVLGPVYISEMAPPKLRGRLVGMFQINIVVGILLAYLSNSLIAARHLGPFEWRWELGIPAVPALLFLVMLYTIPRSSRWLATKDRIDEAREVLAMLGTPNSELELQEILDSVRVDRSAKHEPVFQRKYAKSIYLAIAIGGFNQLSGINAILYYLPRIFEAAGFSQVSGNIQAIAVGAMNLVATIIAMSMIDILGRKPLLLWGSVGCSACLGMIASIFFKHSHQQYLVWLLVANIFFFATSQGAVIWVYISEIFPNRVRARGQAIGCSAHWVMNAIVSFLFPLLAVNSGGYPFVFFSAMMVLQFFIVFFTFPETKGATLEQLQARLEIPSTPRLPLC